MKTYTNVVLDRAERDILKTAALHLRIAFPRMDEEMPKRQRERLDDHEARVIAMLIRDTTTGTFDNLARAQAVLAKLVRVIEPQTSIDFWQADHRELYGVDAPVSAVPTSAYQRYRMLAEIRQDQLRDAKRAHELVIAAGNLASPIHGEEHAECAPG